MQTKGFNSGELLSLRNDYDGEGSNPPGLETIRKAYTSVVSMKHLFKDKFDIFLEEAEYYICNGRNIKACWEKSGKYEVFVYVPCGDEPASYSIEYNGDSLEGTLESSLKDFDD